MAVIHDSIATARISPQRSTWPLDRADRDPLAFLEALSASGADVVPFYVGRRHAFLLNHPDRIDEVLVRRANAFVKGRGYDRAQRLLGTGLLTVPAHAHRSRRQVAQGAFHRQRVEGHAPTIVGHALRRRDSWRAGAPIDMAREMRELTLTIAGETLFGADLGPWTETVAAALALAAPPMDGLRAVVAPPATARRARHELECVIDAIIAPRLEDSAGRTDLLSMLMEARSDDEEASERQLRDDVLTFLLASHDTVSHALTWTWLLLATHSEVDDRLGAEIAHALGTRSPTANDVPRLLYTRAVVSEALRLFPPAWVIVRRAVERCALGDVTIPAGALVVASPFAMHRAPQYFEQPLQFRPERWLATPEDPQAARPKRAYFPFGAGPRACIGEGFAWFEATLILATIAQSWRVARSSTAAIATSAKITLRPRNEPPMIPRPR